VDTSNIVIRRVDDLLPGDVVITSDGDAYRVSRLNGQELSYSWDHTDFTDEMPYRQLYITRISTGEEYAWAYDLHVSNSTLRYSESKRRNEGVPNHRSIVKVALSSPQRLNLVRKGFTGSNAYIVTL
jgi:hypothetical protein